MTSQQLRHQSFEHVTQILESNLDQGLSDSKVHEKQTLYGSNAIIEKKTHPYRDFFLEQLKDPIILILLTAALIKYITDGIQDTSAILAVVVFNISLGLFHQRKAIKAVEALKSMINPQARVLRNGLKQDICAIDLVPGDIIFLESGMKIPADARLIESIDFMCDESLLTGESVPVLKNPYAKVAEGSQAQDYLNCVFSGTIVTKGRAKAIVIDTGSKTEIGKIAESLSSIDDSPSPLQIRLDQFSKKLSLGIIILITLMAFIGFLKGYQINELFLIAISLIVSAIPEGLPLAITMCLILGIQKMAEKKALVKRLSSVETLGSTTVICSDKTGTLTCNQMTVTHVCVADKVCKVTGTGYEEHGHIDGQLNLHHLLINAAYNNETTLKKVGNQVIVQGDPTEAALIILSKKHPHDVQISSSQIIVPFESENRFMASIITLNNQKMLYIKGALDKVLLFCDKMLDNQGKTLPLDRAAIETLANQMSEKQLRIIAFAHLAWDHHESPKNFQGCIFSGFVGMQDPLRPHIHETVKKCENAGIALKMITGDHPHTAQAIYKQIKGHGMHYLLKGADIDALSSDEKQKQLVNTDVFARVSPHNKLEIVQALKKSGHVVAMTGDGVNDSPSLKGADIGIAMGSGSDVAKETASIILLDDNFVTLVKAVEMGRMIYITLQNLIIYLLMTALSGVLTICLSIFMGWPLPVLPIQLLWINLVTDGSTTIPMIFEKLRPSLMQKKPIKKDAPIVDKNRLIQMICLGSIMSLGTLSIFYYSWHIREDSILYSQTMAFSALALFQIFNAQNARSKDEPCLFSFKLQERSLKRIPFSFNIPLILTMILALILQYLACEMKLLQPFIKTVGLHTHDWLLIICSSFAIIIFSDLYKWIRFLKTKNEITHEH